MDDDDDEPALMLPPADAVRRFGGVHVVFIAALVVLLNSDWSEFLSSTPISLEDSGNLQFKSDNVVKSEFSSSADGIITGRKRGIGIRRKDNKWAPLNKKHKLEKTKKKEKTLIE
uniref:Uncharacterized protein n=1 Tax=Romanomermis culicivorax TaxID=13658 RepID=A0A915JAR5_ROMCU